MRHYGGFCPVAKATEVIGDRWTLLIVREMLCGSRRFSEIERGLPGIPRALLSQRLRALERAGVTARRVEEGGKHTHYELTAAGLELYDIVYKLGEWGRRWVQHNVEDGDVEPTMLMWDVHRRIHIERLPAKRVVVQFDFCGLRRQSVWLVLERPDPSVCLHDPGYGIDLLVTADTLALHRVWMGYLPYATAVDEGLLVVDGPPALAQALPTWLALNLFSAITPAEAG